MTETTHPPSSAREFFRRLDGNELKILTAIYYLEQDGVNPTADAIAAEARMGRSTVYNKLKRLQNNAYVVYTLSSKGRAAVDIALSGFSREFLDANITDTPGPSPKCLPGNATSPTGVQNQDSAKRVNPSQIGTESRFNTDPTLSPPAQQLTRTKDSTGFVSAHVRRGKDLAKQTARALNDMHSLGMHTQLWYRALTVDETNGNRSCENTILSYTTDLLARYNKTGRHQGAAFTARVKALIQHAENELRK